MPPRRVHRQGFSMLDKYRGSGSGTTSIMRNCHHHSSRSSPVGQLRERLTKRATGGGGESGDGGLAAVSAVCCFLRGWSATRPTVRANPNHPTDSPITIVCHPPSPKTMSGGPMSGFAGHHTPHGFSFTACSAMPRVPSDSRIRGVPPSDWAFSTFRLKPAPSWRHSRY